MLTFGRDFGQVQRVLFFSVAVLKTLITRTCTSCLNAFIPKFACSMIFPFICGGDAINSPVA